MGSANSGKGTLCIGYCPKLRLYGVLETRGMCIIAEGRARREYETSRVVSKRRRVEAVGNNRLRLWGAALLLGYLHVLHWKVTDQILVAEEEV